MTPNQVPAPADSHLQQILVMMPCQGQSWIPKLEPTKHQLVKLSKTSSHTYPVLPFQDPSRLFFENELPRGEVATSWTLRQQLLVAILRLGPRVQEERSRRIILTSQVGRFAVKWPSEISLKRWMCTSTWKQNTNGHPLQTIRVVRKLRSHFQMAPVTTMNSMNQSKSWKKHENMSSKS